MAKLTKKQELFVKEYLIDLNATQAAIRAGYSKKTAQEIGAQNLSKLMIAEAIQVEMDKRAERTEITQDMVLNRWWKIATADPRSLIAYHRESCRYCYGEGHKYQWKDESEFEAKYAAAVKSQEENPDEIHIIPDNEGGYGFNPTLTPHAKCPECFGLGNGRAIAKDTRTIDEDAAVLYAGVKTSKEGLEIKMQDQGKALENVAKHLGMFTDKLEITGEISLANEIAKARARV